MKPIDLTGMKVNKLTVLKETTRRHAKAPRRWLCRCECGVEKEIDQGKLTTGTRKSCGCTRLGIVMPRTPTPPESDDVKECPDCEEIKPVTCFSMRSDTGKRRRQCIVCHNKVRHIRDPLRPKKAPLTDDQKRSRRHEYYHANRATYNRKRREYYLAHKEQENEKIIEYREKHGDYLKQKQKEARQANPEKHRRRAREYQRNRCQTDIAHRMSRILRTRIWSEIKQAASHKSASGMTLAGCSPTELIRYLESKFYGGMTWKSFGQGYGTFQIDHIIPVGLFDLTDPEQQRKCFHYTNLQPLWYDDHKKKTIEDLKKIRLAKSNA